jgi:hypothetical protein
LSRFAADNAAINARFGIAIPLVSEDDIAMSDIEETRAQEHRALLPAVLEATDYCLPDARSPVLAKLPDSRANAPSRSSRESIEGARGDTEVRNVDDHSTVKR